MSTPLPFNPAAHFSSLALPPSIIHPSVTCPRGPFDDDWSLKHIFLPISFPLNPSAPRPSPPLRVYHFLSKPSRISVCFRAVSSTNLASTFSCSSKGFGPARSQKETDSYRKQNSRLCGTELLSGQACTHTCTHILS